MLLYQKNLKKNARTLRTHPTEGEQRVWSFLRRKQIRNIQFFRQRPIGNYIVDFYAPTVKLAIEIDGSQHFEENHRKKDARRDLFLEKEGIKVLRFTSSDAVKNIEGLYEIISKTAEERLKPNSLKIPPPHKEKARRPPLEKGDKIHAKIPFRKAELYSDPTHAVISFEKPETTPISLESEK
jgi:very-short-patch-repair endonuclease